MENKKNTSVKMILAIILIVGAIFINSCDSLGNAENDSETTEPTEIETEAESETENEPYTTTMENEAEIELETESDTTESEPISETETEPDTTATEAETETESEPILETKTEIDTTTIEVETEIEPEPETESATTEIEIEPENKPVSGAAQMYAEFGTVYTLGTWEITVNSIEFIDEINKNSFSYFKSDEGNFYAVIDISVVNKAKRGDSFQKIFSDENYVKIQLIYDGEYEYDTVNLLGYSKSLYNKSVPPLSKKSGQITIVVPQLIRDDKGKSEIIFTYEKDKIVYKY